jgi:hypothetical protein
MTWGHLWKTLLHSSGNWGHCWGTLLQEPRSLFSLVFTSNSCSIALCSDVCTYSGLLCFKVFFKFNPSVPASVCGIDPSFVTWCWPIYSVYEIHISSVHRVGHHLNGCCHWRVKEQEKLTCSHMWWLGMQRRPLLWNTAQAGLSEQVHHHSWFDNHWIHIFAASFPNFWLKWFDLS